MAVDSALGGEQPEDSRQRQEGEGLPWKGSDRRLCHTPLCNDMSLFPQDYLDALTGICYDGIEGLLFLGLFSILAALAFSTLTCAGPRAWKHFINR